LRPRGVDVERRVPGPLPRRANAVGSVGFTGSLNRFLIGNPLDFRNNLFHRAPLGDRIHNQVFKAPAGNHIADNIKHAVAPVCLPDAIQLGKKGLKDHALTGVHGTPVYTFKHFVENVYLPFGRRSWKESTASTSEQIVKTHVAPEFGHCLLHAIRRRC